MFALPPTVKKFENMFIPMYVRLIRTLRVHK